MKKNNKQNICKYKMVYKVFLPSICTYSSIILKIYIK